jgi:hypothetical protein
MTSGGREVLKWVALLLMTGDHVDKALLHGSAPWLGEAGRVVFPIFAFVLAWNLHHGSPGSRAASVRRLVIAGLLVQPLHALVFGFWIPATILFTLALGIFVADPEKPAWIRAAVFLVASFFVDYQWAGVLLVAACFYVIRHLDGWRAWAALALAVLPLCLFNGNAWALLALPLLWWFGTLPEEIPRHRWTFLGFYAAHLAVLAVMV